MTSPSQDEMTHHQARILIVEARFYDEIADMLLTGARQALREADAEIEKITVPGALEIPAAIRLALETDRFDGFVALGCVIQGETRHYDIVANESARGLIDLGVNQAALIGNGILTTETAAQAKVRADPKGKNKGGDAARAVLALIKVKAGLYR